VQEASGSDTLKKSRRAAKYADIEELQAASVKATYRPRRVAAEHPTRASGGEEQLPTHSRTAAGARLPRRAGDGVQWRVDDMMVRLSARLHPGARRRDKGLLTVAVAFRATPPTDRQRSEPAEIRRPRDSTSMATQAPPGDTPSQVEDRGPRTVEALATWPTCCRRHQVKILSCTRRAPRAERHRPACRFEFGAGRHEPPGLDPRRVKARSTGSTDAAPSSPALDSGASQAIFLPIRVRDPVARDLSNVTDLPKSRRRVWVGCRGVSGGRNTGDASSPPTASLSSRVLSLRHLAQPR